MIFKPGMKVYYPTRSRDIFTLALRKDIEHSCFPLVLKGLDVFVSVTEQGLFTKKDKCPCIFLATEKNQKLLQELYKTDFQNPLQPFHTQLLEYFQDNKTPIVVKDTSGTCFIVQCIADTKVFIQGGGVYDLHHIRPYSDSKPFLILNGE